MNSSTAITIAGISFLNSRPLLAGLEAAIAAPFRYALETGSPSVCARRLAGGEAAAALVPVAALPALVGVETVPGLGIACRREATSVLLVSKVPPEGIRTLVADAASRTSVTLARLLLAERWGCRPRLIGASSPLGALGTRADAAVVIGDPALLLHGGTGLLEIDLGAAWVEWTGRPFVFAVWAIRRGAPAGLPELLERSLDWAESRWDELLPGWAAAHRVATPTATRYLRETLHFRLGEAEDGALVEFLSRAAAAGVLPAAEVQPGRG
jgi:predicted solute-binding protein